MEKEEATKVGCQSCKTNKGVERTQKFLYILGFIMFGLSIYGGIRLFKDIMSLF
jgi:CRISPR/Cas system-associated protein endoribonuclease Cas2